MGVVTTRQLSIVSLNYSGILNNPFQFYSQEMLQEQQALSQSFHAEFTAQYPNAQKDGFTWQIGKIDQVIQKDRYSPIYMETCGVQDGRLITEQEFTQKWRLYFEKAKTKIVTDAFKPSQESDMMQFDLLVFRAFKKYCKENVVHYQEMMRRFFQKSFLDEKKKIQKTIAALEKENVDVALIQEGSQALSEAVLSTGLYDIIMCSQSTSAIILRTSKFQRIHNTQAILRSLGPQLEGLLNWNQDTSIAFVDNIIFISGHLSSKLEKNQAQIQQMRDSLQRLVKIYPMLDVVVGLDANKVVESFQRIGIIKFSSFPESETIYTTIKKRTRLQPQIKKANQLVYCCKDYIITTLPVLGKRVVTISGGEISDKSLIPTENHPYDHFVINAHVRVPVYQANKDIKDKIKNQQEL